MEIVDIAYLVAGVAILVTVFNWILPDGSKTLQKKFVSLGNMKGKTLQEIVSVAGGYQLMESNPSGKAYTWSKPKYSIKLGFDLNNVCTSVLGEVLKK